MSLILNVEADELLYRAAFAAEKQAYKLITKNNKVRDFGPKYTKTQILNKLKQLEIKDYTLEGYKIAEPVEHALFLVKRQLKKLAQLGEVHLWLSPSDKSNFRFEIAKELTGPNGTGYKANRPPRPIHYDKIREYLVKHHGAEEVFGGEADDALGMYQSDNTVAVHIDKDINMIEGKHLHWVSGDRYVVEGLGNLPKDGERGTGMAFFWWQMLVGDRIDNIPGIPGIGPVKATKILEKASTDTDMFAIVSEIYYNTYKEKKDYMFTTVADLLYITDSNKKIGSDYITMCAIRATENKGWRFDNDSIN